MPNLSKTIEHQFEVTHNTTPDCIMTISSTNVGHKHVKMYWHTNNPNTKVKVVFNSSTRLWACGNMTGKKPIELARKALHGASGK